MTTKCYISSKITDILASIEHDKLSGSGVNFTQMAKVSERMVKKDASQEDISGNTASNRSVVLNNSNSNKPGINHIQFALQKQGLNPFGSN